MGINNKLVAALEKLGYKIERNDDGDLKKGLDLVDAMTFLAEKSASGNEDLVKAISDSVLDTISKSIDGIGGKLEESLSDLLKSGDDSTPIEDIIKGAVDDAVEGMLGKIDIPSLVDEKLASTISEITDSFGSKVDDLVKGFEDLSKSVLSRKSISSAGFIEKGFAGDDPDKVEIVSLSENPDRVLSMLDSMSGSIEKGESNEFNEAAIDFEISRQLPVDIIKKLEKAENVKFIK